MAGRQGERTKSLIKKRETMLNRVQLLQKLEHIAHDIFVDDTQAYRYVQTIWQTLCADPLISQKLRQANISWPLPSWQGKLDAVYDVETSCNRYCLVSVDGSQIYPDRHYGLSCYLINIGLVVLPYGVTTKPVQMHSAPYVFSGYDDNESLELSTELINCKRQDLEFRYGVELAAQLHGKLSDSEKKELLLLFDGSLIFWYLEAKDTVFKEAFLSRYIMHLVALYKQRILTASYISLPKSRELLNIVRAYICDFDEKNAREDFDIARITDATIVRSYISKGQCTTVFKNHARISKQYPDCVHPYFFYIHVGNEIGRVEIPAWIAQDEELVNRVAMYVYDQCKKGGGYPVGLAEAHEQAVVKGPDRDFFYHLLTKMSISRNRGVMTSQKSQRKRSINL